MVTHVDTDHASKEERKSRWGFFTAIEGKHGTCWLLNHGVKTIKAVTHSPPESEIVAIDHAITRHTIPNIEILEAVFERAVRSIVKTDSATAIAAIKKGYSKDMCHLSRTHGVSIAFLNQERIESGRHELEFVRSMDNVADMMTKILPNELVLKHAMHFKLGSAPELYLDKNVTKGVMLN